MKSPRSGMSCPVSGPCAAERRPVVVAPDARVQRHHQAVVAGHAGHLEQHVPAEGHGGGRLDGARQRLAVDPFGLVVGQRLGADVLVAVVGGGGAVRAEVGPARLDGRHPAGVAAGVDAAHLAEATDGGDPAGRGRLEVAVRPERGNDPAAEAGVRGERRVRGQVVARVVGRGQHLDAEPLEQRARAVVVRGQALGDLVVDRIRRLGGRPHGHVEDLGQGGLEPVARRSAAEQVPVRAEQVPDPPGLRLGRARPGRRPGRPAGCPRRAAGA